ncbi:Avirulence (Avh) protein [Phytophthora megakarya]|uniref:Avirulence (Avh) protein n=1 Tax=Phytophthora megakarya TaxID=4795 RepID=A0A225WII0_9STRA|nr:Avirulence (Avh) protein [Phytophthora megakarya]
MGFYQVVLLIGVLLLGSSDWIQASTNSRLGASGTTTRSLERDDAVTRFLRAYPVDEGVEDERGISAYLPSIEKPPISLSQVRPRNSNEKSRPTTLSMMLSTS